VSACPRHINSSPSPISKIATAQKLPNRAQYFRTIKSVLKCPPRRNSFNRAPVTRANSEPIDTEQRIVLRMKHHDLRRINFRRPVHWVIKLPVQQLLPIPFREPIPLPNARPKICCIAGIRSLLLLLSRQNPPIHHRTIRHHPFHSRIQRRKNRRRPAKLPPITNTSTAHSRNRAQTPARETLSPTRRLHPEYPCAETAPEIRRHSPSPPIARIKTPNILRRQKFRERLLPRNRRHPIAQDDRRCVFKTRPAAKTP